MVTSDHLITYYIMGGKLLSQSLFIELIIYRELNAMNTL